MAHKRKSSLRQVSKLRWKVPENGDYKKALRMQQKLLEQRKTDEDALKEKHDRQKKVLQMKLDACNIDHAKLRSNMSILALPDEAERERLLDEMQVLLQKQKVEVLQAKRLYDDYERDMEMDVHSRRMDVCKDSKEKPPAPH